MRDGSAPVLGVIASMRPRHKAAENAVMKEEEQQEMKCFNEAAA